MDFYTRQDDAGSRSRAFYFAFGLAVVGAVVALYFVVTFCFLSVGVISPFWPSYSGTFIERLFAHALPPTVYGSPPHILAWRPFIIVTSSLALFILAMSLYKTWHIRKGGGAYMAEQMGGQLLLHATSFAEQRLLNVVEEMSVASGLPRPRVYIFKRENSINAITAGLSHQDAIVAFTQGALNHLSRDEMQGVTAHEFAHILNGDYRLNLTMAGWLYGLIFFSVQGRDMMVLAGDYMEREAKYSILNFYRFIAVPMYVMGAVLWIGGWIGKFGAEIIQAAFSREREHLADAFAVQFTRNPLGLAGALKKIAAAAGHGRMKNGAYMMMRSFFFVSPARFRSLWDSHPPLEKRILILDPAWDGDLPDLKKVYFDDQTRLEKMFKPVRTTEENRFKFNQLIDGVNMLERDWGYVLVQTLFSAAAAESASPSVPRGGNAPPQINGDSTIAAGNGLDSSITLEAKEHWGRALDLAERLYKAMPAELRTAAEDPDQAAALVMAIFLSDQGEELRALQLDQIRSLAGEDRASEADRFRRLMARPYRLPLLGLAAAALKDAAYQAQVELERVVKALVAADNRLDIFEVSACQILKSSLGLKFQSAANAPAVGLDVTTEDEAVMLSAMAYAGAPQSAQAQGAYQCGLVYLGYRPASKILPRDMVTTQGLSKAIDRLSGSSLADRRNFLRAMVAVAVHDQKINEAESEILRAMAAALDIPLPLFGLKIADAENIMPGEAEAMPV